MSPQHWESSTAVIMKRIYIDFRVTKYSSKEGSLGARLKKNQSPGSTIVLPKSITLVIPGIVWVRTY